MTHVEMVHSVVVGGLIRNNNNQVLLIRHHKRGWEIPQGKVEAGENLLEALQREVREEAGVEIEPGPLAAVWSMVTPPAAVIFAFLGRYSSGDLIPCGDCDSMEACWAEEERALEMVTGTIMRERLKALLEYNGSLIYRSYTVKPYQLQLEQVLAAGTHSSAHLR